jgi:Domain of unknown function (DUF5110)
MAISRFTKMKTMATATRKEYTRQSPFHWDDAKQTLTIGERKGTFPGMLTERRFQIVFVRENHGAGITAESKPDKVVPYAGKQRA